MNERVKKVIKHSGLNNRRFAERVGVADSTIGDIVLGKKGAGLSVIDKILTAFPEVNSQWLISGSGDMLSSAAVLSPDGTGIPLISIDAVAGFSIGMDNEGVEKSNLDHYVVPEFERIGAEFVIRVSGNSMYPKYGNGDVLACKKIKEIIFFQWGKVYVLDTSQGALVKRLFEHENPDLVTCSSDNKSAYPPFTLPKTDIRSLSIVLGVIRIE